MVQKKSTPAKEHNCQECSLREACLPAGLTDRETALLDQYMVHRRSVAKRDILFRAGEPLKSLYMVSSGVFKTVVINQDGSSQVTGFRQDGAVLGLEAINRGQHGGDCVALTDAEVCEIGFDTYEKMAQLVPNISHHFMRLMAREIEREQNLMLVLGGLRADEKVAAFLSNWVAHNPAQKKGDWVLPMTREDLGSYLGLTIETVSRTFTKLKEEEILGVRGRHIHITDPARLNALNGH
jgi:CRP/FNR family transcriptional regulator